MVLPFLHCVGVGVQIGQDAVRWVELSAFRGKRVRLRCYEEEPIVGGRVQEALGRLRERVRTEGKWIHSHVDPVHVELDLVDVPDFDDDEDVYDWLESESVRRQGGSDCLVASRRVASKALLGQVPAEHVLAIQTLFEKADIPLHRVGSGAVESVSARLAEGHLDETLLHQTEQLCWLIRTEAGGLVEVMPLTVSEEVAFEEAKRHATTRNVLAEPRQIVVVGTQSSETKKPPVQLIGNVPPEAALPGGLAAEALFSGLVGIDFLPDEAGKESRDLIDKTLTQHALLWMLVGLMVLLLLPMLAGMFFNNRIANVEAQLMEQTGSATTLQQLREDVVELRAQVSEGMGERTRLAEWLSVLGRELPGGTWISSVSLDEETTSLSVTVLSDDLGGVQAYLLALNRSDAFGEAGLVVSERLEAETVERATEVRRELVEAVLLVSPQE